MRPGNKAAQLSGAALLSGVLLAFASAADDARTLVVSRKGFQPETLRAHKGETLKVRIEAADEEHCFALDALRIEKRVRPGRPIVVDITPDRAGTFDFHCCLEPADATPRGRLVVSD